MRHLTKDGINPIGLFNNKTVSKQQQQQYQQQD